MEGKMSPFDYEDVLAIAKAVKSRECRVSDYYFDNNSCVFDVKIDDDSWGSSESFDFRIAALLIKIQKDFLQFASLKTGARYDFKSLKTNDQLVVKYKITSGCVNINFSVCKIWNYLINNLRCGDGDVNGGVISGLIAVSTALNGIREWVGLSGIDKKIEELTASESEYCEVFQDARRILENGKSSWKFVGDYLTEKGVVSVNEEAAVSRKEILSLIKSVNSNKVETYYVDGVYKLSGNKFSPPKVYIDIAGSERDAVLEDLSFQDRELLAQMVHEGTVSQNYVFAQLQVNVIAGDGGIRRIKVVGLGNPREGSIDSELLLEKIAKRNLSVDDVDDDQYFLPI